MSAIAPGPFESKMMATTLDAMGEAIAEAAPLICDSTAVQDNVGEVVCETQRDDELAHVSRPRSGPEWTLARNITTAWWSMSGADAPSCTPSHRHERKACRSLTFTALAATLICYRSLTK